MKSLREHNTLHRNFLLWLLLYIVFGWGTVAAYFSPSSPSHSHLWPEERQNNESTRFFEGWGRIWLIIYCRAVANTVHQFRYHRYCSMVMFQLWNRLYQKVMKIHRQRRKKMFLKRFLNHRKKLKSPCPPQFYPSQLLLKSVRCFQLQYQLLLLLCRLHQDQAFQRCAANPSQM